MENKSDIKVPVHPKSLIVPLANPATAERMLRLALSIVDPDKGHIVALTVALESAEEASETQEAMQVIVDKLNHELREKAKTAKAKAEAEVQASTENANGENANGENANGENANGENANSENANSENANSENANSENANSENANGENANGENANSENANSENAGDEDDQDESDDDVERQRIELVMRGASSVTRGILDATREYGAKAMIMGVYRPNKRQVKVGTVVENVIQGAMCDVLAYRANDEGHSDFKRVVVPVDGSRKSRVALRFGALIADSLGIPLVYSIIQRDYNHSTEFQQHLDVITSILPEDQVERDMTLGNNPAEVLLRKFTSSDLVVLGFTQKNEFENQIDNNLSDVLLNRSESSVLLASRLIDKDNASGAFQQFMQRFNLTLTTIEKNELIWQARQSVVNNIDYVSMIILSASLASLGLLLNSVAVIIGAMLVAPLMTPLVALSAGIVGGQLDITQRSFFFMVQGVLLSLLVSILAGLMLPIESATGEMLARGNPTLLDAAVALVSGWVGGYATARKDIPAALAGVAIAAALMPPLCTVGLAFAIGENELALGSSLLFLTNIVFIVLAQSVVFLWFGMKPGRRQTSLLWTRIWWGVLGVMLLVVVTQLINLSQQALDTIAIRDRLMISFEQSEFVSIETDNSDVGLFVLLTVRTDSVIQPAQVAEAQTDLTEFLARDVFLSVAYLPVVQAGSPVISPPFESLPDVPFEALPDVPAEATAEVTAEVTAQSP